MDKWFLTTARLESEIVFLHSWFDATLILIDQGDRTNFNLFGFATPFDRHVWLAIAATVVFSAFFMMFIDYMERARDNRSWKTWIGDHMYLSNLAFSQNFTYDMPKSGAGRVFLSTFSFWSMLIGATYTANLASLLVENALASPISSIKGAMDAELAICIHDGSASDTIVTAMHPSIVTYDKVVKTSTPTEMYEKLALQQCDILVGTRQEFEILRVQEKYGCNLVQAGPEIHSGAASFAIKFDPLSCDSVLAYVLNIHLHAMSIDGNMTKYWDSYIDNIDSTCANKEELQQGRRLEIDEFGSVEDWEEFDMDMESRRLKGSGSTGGGGGGGGSSESNAFVGGSSGDAEVLQIEGMAGVFFVHGLGTAVALVLVMYTQLRRKYIKAPKHRRREQEVLMSKTKLLSERPAETDLHLKYEDLKKDFMSQLDDLFEQHLETTQKSRNSASYGNETASEESVPSSTASPSLVVSPPTRNSGFDMDGAIRTSISGGDAKAEAKSYHSSTRNLAGTNASSMDGVTHSIGLGRAIGSGREAKMDAKAYHKASRRNLADVKGSFAGSTRNLSTRNLSGDIKSSTDGPVLTMGSGRGAKMNAKAYHKESRRNLADINESFRGGTREGSDIGESFRDLQDL